jgi:hypothetical protein
MTWPTPAEEAAVAHLRREHEALAAQFGDVGRAALARAMPPGDLGPMCAEWLRAAEEQRPATWRGRRFDRAALLDLLTTATRGGHVGNAQGRAALLALDAADGATWCFAPFLPAEQEREFARSRARLAALALTAAAEPAPAPA